MLPLVRGALYECRHVSVALARNSEPRWRTIYVYMYMYIYICAHLHDTHIMMVCRERVHAHITHERSLWVHMYVCSHVPGRCSALGRSATQNSARPYYLRFVSWLQTITHFPGSSHLSPSPPLLRLSAFISLAQRPPSSPPLSISFPFSSISLRCSNPLPPSSVHPFVLLLSFPRLFHPLSWPLFSTLVLFAFRLWSCIVRSCVMVSLLSYHQPWI